LLLDATRRAVVEPAAFEGSAELRLMRQLGAASITFVDPDGATVRTLGERDRTSLVDVPSRDAHRQLDRARAIEAGALLARLDPREADDEATPR
jgi:hypothetical protein